MLLCLCLLLMCRVIVVHNHILTVLDGAHAAYRRHEAVAPFQCCKRRIVLFLLLIAIASGMVVVGAQRFPPPNNKNGIAREENVAMEKKDVGMYEE